MTTTDTVQTGAWVIGNNMAGYSPDPDNVHAFADWADAWSSLVEDAQRWGDDDDEAHDQEWDETGCSRAAVDAMTHNFHENGITPDRDYSFLITTNDGRMDLAWWVQWEATATPDEN